VNANVRFGSTAAVYDCSNNSIWTTGLGRKDDPGFSKIARWLNYRVNRSPSPLFLFLRHAADGAREYNVGRTVQCSLRRVLENADDEADGNDLHRDIVRNAEQAAA